MHPFRRATMCTPCSEFLLLALVTSLTLVCHAAVPPADSSAPATAKVLRYAFPIAESGFDPAQVTDLYSNTVLAHIFEAPLEYEYLAEPTRMRANTAAALPEVSDDFKRFVFRIRPGIYFADDPAFKGVRRELTAADYVYSIKRHYDPRWKSGKLYQLEAKKLLGLSELRREVIAQKKAFDYEREVPRACARSIATASRYAWPNRHRASRRTSPTRAWWVPWRARWSSSTATGQRTPGGHRALQADAVDAQFADGARAQPRLSRGALRRASAGRRCAPGAVANTLRGKRLPIVDRIEVAVIEQQQPRWLSFLNQRARRDRARARGVCAAGRTQQPAGALPGQARHPDAALPARRRGVFLLCDGEPGGGRLHARQGRPAPRDFAGRRPGPRDSSRAQQPGHSRAVDRRAAGSGATTRRSSRR